MLKKNILHEKTPMFGKRFGDERNKPNGTLGISKLKFKQKFKTNFSKCSEIALKNFFIQRDNFFSPTKKSSKSPADRSLLRSRIGIVTQMEAGLSVTTASLSLSIQITHQCKWIVVVAIENDLSQSKTFLERIWRKLRD